MKKLIIFTMLIIFVFSISAEVFEQPHPQNSKPVILERRITPTPIRRNREVPEHSFIIDPQNLQFGYADYFQTYNDTPIDIQPAVSMPNGHPAGGIYVGYRTKDSSGNSQVNYAYIDGETGDVLTDVSMGVVGYYVDLEINDETGDPFMTWHAYIDPDDTGDCYYSYDIFHLIGTYGLWRPPVMWLDSSDQTDLFPYDDDMFVWPNVKIGPSPLEDYKRIYVYSSNSTNAHITGGNPSENVILAYADFTTEDLDNQVDFEWTYQTIPQLDAFNAADPEWRRPFKGFEVHDNIVLFMGYHIGTSDTPPWPEDKMFVLLNENYGEGGFEMIESEDWFFEMDNPETLDGTGHLFENEDGTERPVRASIGSTGHFNINFKDDYSKVSFIGSMNVNFQDNADDKWYYWGNANMFYPKEFIFDLNTHEFSFYDIYPRGEHPADNIPMHPWDLDEDGDPDNYDADGYPTWEMDWPIYYHDPDESFHYNHYVISKNEERGWLAAVWTDGTNAKAAYDGIEGYEDWADITEIAIAVSKDNGETWADPIFMNGKSDDPNYASQLDGMIPCFVYPADVIEDIGDNHGKLHLFFLDDNSFGSYHSGQHGLDTGGTFQYAAIDILFEYTKVEEELLVELRSYLHQNYPNPFTPETTISYSVPQVSEINLEVFNLKGQKVRTLVNDSKSKGDHSVVWNGTDDNGNPVSSGIYLYKLSSKGRFTSTKKMIMMR